MATHREQTKRKTRRWQALAVVLVASAGAVVAVSLGDLLGPGTARWQAPASGVDEGAAPRLVMVDTTKAEGVMRSLAPPPAVAVVEPTDPLATNDTTETPTETPVTPPPAPAALVYIGSMGTSKSRGAVMRQGEGSSQFALLEGQSRGNLTLVSVAPDHVMVNDSGVEKKIEKALAMNTSVFPENVPRKQPGAAAKGTGGNAKAPVAGAANTPPSNRAQEMAELARRAAEAAANPTTIGTAGDPARRAFMATQLNNGDLSFEIRAQMLREVGFPDGATFQERLNILREMGVNVEQNPRLAEQLKLMTDDEINPQH